MTFLNRSVIVAMLGFLSFAASAQLITLSPKVGLGHLMYIDDYEYHNSEVRIAPVFGLGAEYSIASKQSLNVELFYSQERHDVHHKNVVHFTDFMPGPSERSVISRKHKVVLPFSFQKSFGAKSNWFWNAGPYVSYLALLQTTYIDGAHRSSRTHAPTSNRWGSGLHGGVGVKIPMVAGQQICLELKARLGVENQTMRFAPWMLLAYEFGLRKQKLE